MKNKTAESLSVIAYVIWIVGGLGTIIISSSIAESFKGSFFESLGNQTALTVFVAMAFGVFSNGMVFYGLSAILKLIELKIPSEMVVEATPGMNKHTEKQEPSLTTSSSQEEPTVAPVNPNVVICKHCGKPNSKKEILCSKCGEFLNDN